MKTALFNTKFWKDSTIYSLNSDTKLVYISLLTNPERNTTRFYQCADRFLVSQTGYDYKLIDICKAQLVEKKLMRFGVDDWVVIGDQAYIKPTKGKLSQRLYFDDLNCVPPEVVVIESEMNWKNSFLKKEYFSDEDDQKLMSGSGESQEYNNKDNNNITKEPVDNFDSGDRFSNREIVWEFSDDEKNEVSWK